MAPATHLEVQGLELGAVDRLTDALVALAEGQGFVSKKAVGRYYQGGLVCFSIEATVEFGKEEVDLIRCFLRDGIKLKNLWEPEEDGGFSGEARLPGLRKATQVCLELKPGTVRVLDPQ